MRRGNAAAPPLSTAELEREIGSSRRRVGAALDALVQRLSPRRLLQKGMAMASRFFGGEGRDGAGFRFEPVALGLIGAGILWLVAANADRRRRQTAHGAAGPVAANGEFPDADAEPRRTTKPPQESVADFIEENPLLAGIAGITIGAVLGFLLPPSRREEERIARAREDLWRQAEALGHLAAARIREVGRGSGAANPPASE
jgi:hypothetical protein